MAVSSGLRALPPLPSPSTILKSARVFPLLRSNLSLYCCSSRTSSPSIPADARRRDPDPGEHCSPRGSPPRAGPRLRGGGSAPSTARGLARAPPEPLCRTRGLDGEKGLAQLGGCSGCGEGLAWLPPPGPGPAAARTACLSHLCAWIPGHRDSDAQLRGPTAPAAGGRGRGQRRGGGWRRSRGWGGGWKAGPWRRGRQGGVLGRAPLSSLAPPTLHNRGLRPRLTGPPDGHLASSALKGRSSSIAPWWWPHHHCALDGLPAHFPSPLTPGTLRLAYYGGLANMYSGGLTFQGPSDLSSNTDLASCAPATLLGFLCPGCLLRARIGGGQALGQL